jgi:hypothetical protein
MTSTSASFLITAYRDSVCAGDDIESHDRPFTVPLYASMPELIRLATNACGLPSISGDKATWIVKAGGKDGTPIAVVAQQWEEPRLLLPGTTTVQIIFGEHKWVLFLKYLRHACGIGIKDGAQENKLTLFFRYWCQANPDAVFNALMSNSPLPSPYDRT